LEEEKGRKLKQVEKMDSSGGFLGAANTNLVYHAKQLLALYETDRPYALSVPQLETVGQWSYDGSLTHNMTAHPKVCPATGELIFFGYELTSPQVHYAVADKEGKLVRSFSIPTRGGKPVMMHDMAITARYSLLLEFPLYFEMDRAMKGAMPYVHDATSPSRFGILPRHAAGPADVRWFEGKSAMSFHIANAWEEEGDVIKMVGCPQETFSFAYGDSSPSVLYEWTFDLSSGETVERRLDSMHVEFPVVHPRVVGRKGRFVWCAVFAGTGHPFHSICGCVKYDLQTGTQLRHNFVGHRWGGESVFASTGDDEDAGYLLTYTFNPEDNTTELYIVDAKTMDPNPVAILRTPQRIPFGFHGLWVPSEEL